VFCMLCVFCRSRGDCPTSVYTKQPVFNRTATCTQREFVIDYIIIFQLYVLPLCFVCFLCCAVRGVIAPRWLIQNNQCLIGRPHIHRESLSLIAFSRCSCMFCHCALSVEDHQVNSVPLYFAVHQHLNCKFLRSKEICPDGMALRSR